MIKRSVNLLILIPSLIIMSSGILLWYGLFFPQGYRGLPVISMDGTLGRIPVENLLAITLSVYVLCLFIFSRSFIKKRKVRSREPLPYGPATLPIEDERVADDDQKPSFKDTGVYGRIGFVTSE